MSKLNMAEPIGIFIFNGIFDRFPDLRIGSMESGVGWFAWYAEYCDRTWEKQRYWTESVIDRLPSSYMDSNVWGSFIQDRTGILSRDLPGGRNIMWSSDYPHSETTFPNSHEIIKRDFAGVPDEDIQDIICNNAKKFLRIS
jgi:predicted TIM-barrel fold metal-dependent hydrolase